MKKSISTVAALALACASLTVSTPAFAQAKGSGSETAKFCQEIMEFYPNQVQGNCLAYFRTDENTPAILCLYDQREGFFERLGYATVADCVRDRRAASGLSK